MASAGGSKPESLNSSRYCRIISASFGTIKESQFTFLLTDPERENETLPSITACSIAVINSHGSELHKLAQSAISASSKCQYSTYTSSVFSSTGLTPINV